MIIKIKHRGLRWLYENGDRSGLNPQHVEKIEVMLANLDEAVCPEDMNVPEYKLHPLKGNLAGYWSITIRANWRIIFRFEDGDTTDVDLTDYH